MSRIPDKRNLQYNTILLAICSNLRDSFKGVVVIQNLYEVSKKSHGVRDQNYKMDRPCLVYDTFVPVTHGGILIVYINQ